MAAHSKSFLRSSLCWVYVSVLGSFLDFVKKRLEHHVGKFQLTASIAPTKVCIYTAFCKRQALFALLRALYLSIVHTLGPLVAVPAVRKPPRCERKQKKGHIELNHECFLSYRLYMFLFFEISAPRLCRGLGYFPSSWVPLPRSQSMSTRLYVDFAGGLKASKRGNPGVVMGRWELGSIIWWSNRR